MGGGGWGLAGCQTCGQQAIPQPPARAAGLPPTSSSVPSRRFLDSMMAGTMDSAITATVASLPTAEVKTAAREGGGEGEAAR